MRYQPYVGTVMVTHRNVLIFSYMASYWPEAVAQPIRSQVTVEKSSDMEMQEECLHVKDWQNGWVVMNLMGKLIQDWEFQLKLVIYHICICCVLLSSFILFTFSSRLDLNKVNLCTLPKFILNMFCKSHNAPGMYPTMHYFATEMWTCVHIFVAKWCIMGYLPDALWDLWDGSIRKSRDYRALY